jgi:hypothetical protein
MFMLCIKRVAFVLFCLISFSSFSFGSCPPSTPDPLEVEVGVWGKPPALVDIEWPFNEDFTYASEVQIEFRQVTGGTDRLLYQRWFSESDLLWGSRHFFYSWHVDDSLNWFRKYYLIGAGPGKIRTFPSGEYVVRWRARYDYCGNQSGDWISEWSETRFQIDALSGGLEIEAQGLNMVSAQDDLDFNWSNNFASSSYNVEIRRGGRIVRKATLRGGFGYFGMINSRQPGLEESQIDQGSYQDRPQFNRELPNHPEYIFRVRGYSPISRKWSDWAELNFEINRGAPDLPALDMSQNDYDGFFDRSLRPFFFADYGGAPALWTYFDVNSKNARGRLSVVRRIWVSRYDFGYGYIGGSGGRWNPQAWQKDLPPGEYVWRVRAYNGPAPEQSAWSSFRTNIVHSPGVLAKPDATKISYSQDEWSLYVKWDAVPNAYAYKYEIRRAGKVVRRSKIVDQANYGVWFNLNDGVLRAESYAGKPLPELDGYQIRVQAINNANSAGKASEWSDWSAPFSLIPASISGRVTDSSGKGIPDVNVFAAIEATKEQYESWSGWWNTGTSYPIYSEELDEWTDSSYWVGRSTTTDKNGNYKINYLRSGSFRVRFEADDYKTQVWPNINDWNLSEGNDVFVGESQSVTGINAILVPWD